MASKKDWRRRCEQAWKDVEKRDALLFEEREEMDAARKALPDDLTEGRTLSEAVQTLHSSKRSCEMFCRKKLDALREILLVPTSDWTYVEKQVKALCEEQERLRRREADLEERLLAVNERDEELWDALAPLGYKSGEPVKEWIVGTIQTLQGESGKLCKKLGAPPQSQGEENAKGLGAELQRVYESLWGDLKIALAPFGYKDGGPVISWVSDTLRNLREQNAALGKDFDRHCESTQAFLREAREALGIERGQWAVILQETRALRQKYEKLDEQRKLQEERDRLLAENNALRAKLDDLRRQGEECR